MTRSYRLQCVAMPGQAYVAKAKYCQPRPLFRRAALNLFNFRVSVGAEPATLGTYRACCRHQRDGDGPSCQMGSPHAPRSDDVTQASTRTRSRGRASMNDDPLLYAVWP